MSTEPAPEPLTAEEERELRADIAHGPEGRALQVYGDDVLRLLATLDRERAATPSSVTPDLRAALREAAERFLTDSQKPHIDGWIASAQAQIDALGPIARAALATPSSVTPDLRANDRIRWLEGEVRRLAAIVGEAPQAYDPDNFPPSSVTPSEPTLDVERLAVALKQADDTQGLTRYREWADRIAAAYVVLSAPSRSRDSEVKHGR